MPTFFIRNSFNKLFFPVTKPLEVRSLYRALAREARRVERRPFEYQLFREGLRAYFKVNSRNVDVKRNHMAMIAGYNVLEGLKRGEMPVPAKTFMYYNI
ncbi:hypothetical protein H696_04531 [Fonticula alba]|uniref:Uncharacterized protein n=1 Tax=Fonticula alba TaxID=691883 RepID=A0A058Z4C6_FONAL|nr:hypothetical protein H696_04531 [Fonticula alba]KCV69115.1 hypothetical protein H696_04531 [Fonticula alba]|eukprot:XP_009496686.1 hypothetical protein H696_04531 [Fonticula alba]